MTKPSGEEVIKQKKGVRESRESRVGMKRVMEEGEGVEGVRGREHRAAAGGMFR